MYLIFRRPRAIPSLPYRRILNLKSFCSSSKIVPPYTPIGINRNIAIKTMSKEDLARALGWAKKENWNPGHQEHEAFYAADPLGYRMLWLDGKPIASLATVMYSRDYAFFGLYIVDRKFRGQGYGKLLWDVSMKTVSACSSLALNGVLDQVDTYQSSGFYPSNINTRWSASLFSLDTKKSSLELPLTNQVALDEIADLDHRSSSIYRPNFWKELLVRPESFYLTLKEGGEIKGFGLISQCVNGYKLGPIYASKQYIAESIVTELCNYAQNVVRSSGGKNLTIQLDTTESNQSSVQFAEKLGFTRVFDTVRMYKGPKPEMDDSITYGLTSLEIG